VSGPTWEALRRALHRHEAQRVESGGARAAVALILRESEPARIELLFIRRAEHDQDPWSGQVGFPGGRAEVGDASLAATAVRETLEETAIDLARHGEPIGALDEVHALARGRPVDLVIAPFVYRLRGQHAGSPSPEAKSLHWLALERLLAPASRSSFAYTHEGRSLALPCLRLDELVIWGLTFRMFSSLEGLLRTTAN